MKLTLPLFVVLVFNSCLSVLNNKLNLSESIPIMDSAIIGDKKVVFLGIRHIGTEEYYGEIRKRTSKYYDSGFKFFVESMGVDKEGNLILDTIALKKVRKLLNVDISVKYADNSNALMEALVKKYELKNQPTYFDLSISDFTILDIPYPTLIADFESMNGPVLLDSCDLKTPLGGTYPCNSVSKQIMKIFKQQYIFEKRELYVAEKLKNSNSSKIFLIYGADHIKNIKSHFLK